MGLRGVYYGVRWCVSGSKRWCYARNRKLYKKGCKGVCKGVCKGGVCVRV